MTLLSKDAVAKKYDQTPKWVDHQFQKDPKFPRPRKLGRYNRWVEKEIDDHIASLPVANEPGKKGGYAK